VFIEYFSCMVYGGIISPIHLNQTHANKKTQVIKKSNEDFLRIRILK